MNDDYNGEPVEVRFRIQVTGIGAPDLLGSLGQRDEFRFVRGREAPGRMGIEWSHLLIAGTTAALSSGALIARALIVEQAKTTRLKLKLDFLSHWTPENLAAIAPLLELESDEDD